MSETETSDKSGTSGGRDAPPVMYLVFTDQAEYYAVCETCYGTYRGMQWSGSTRQANWRAASDAYLEKHRREDGRCEFCDPKIGNGGWVLEA